MGSVHQGPINRNGNEIEVARADLARALKRVVEAEISPESPFAEREIVALAAADEATREYCERELAHWQRCDRGKLQIVGRWPNEAQ